MWIFEQENKLKVLEEIEINEIPEGMYGFIYEIDNLTKGKSYIGKKNFYSERKVNLPKKEISEDKRLKKYKYVKKESDWREYCGSNKALLEDIKNGDAIRKYILAFATSKRELTYKETKFLFNHAVLESEEYYNDNIENKYFRGNLK